MKKYFTLGELLIDYRKYRNISQLDFAGLLDVDVRTIIRWEKNESLIKVEKEKLLIKNFGIPHQVIRNLNTDKPIAIYFDFQRWVYSLSFLSRMVTSSWEFNKETEFETDRIETLSNDEDIKFISFIQKNQKIGESINKEVVIRAAKILPELNLVLYGHSGYHAGHISILPLKYETFLQLRDKKKLENQISIQDLNSDFDAKPLVFYYYSLYANSLDNTYYLMNKLLCYFKKQKYEDYILAGISYRQAKIDRLKEMGLQVVWEENIKENVERKATFVAGNIDEFLYGKNPLK
jgi:transcriptional regulator with XRE-family HTH domain